MSEVDPERESRPPIPRPLEREVLVEAGHRCAIPRCGQTPIEIHHIVPWADCREHNFENLIALCPNCHARARDGQGRQGIDRLSLQKYKANLSLLSHRYSEQERRLISAFSEQPNQSIVFGEDADFTLMNLLRDGLIEKQLGTEHRGTTTQVFFGGRSMLNSYRLSEKGKAFVTDWIAGNIS